MSESEAQGKLESYALAGEGMPKWLMFGFALIGLLTAVAAAWVFLSDRSALQEQPTQPATARDKRTPQGPPGAAAQRVAPSPSPPTPKVATAAAQDAQRPEPLKPSQPEPSAANQERVEAPPDQPPLSKTSSPAAQVDCPNPVTILFDSGSARPIDTDLSARVAPLRAWLAEHPDSTLLVDGHADSTGTEQWNLILSYRRAKGLAALLRKAGVSHKQLVVRAAGTLQPVAGLADTAARNRRVVLQLEDSANCRVPSTGSDSKS